MKRNIIIALVAAAALVAGPVAHAEQQPLTLKIATLAPEGTIFYDGLLKMTSEWTKLSGGKVPDGFTRRSASGMDRRLEDLLPGWMAAVADGEAPDALGWGHALGF